MSPTTAATVTFTFNVQETPEKVWETLVNVPLPAQTGSGVSVRL